MQHDLFGPVLKCGASAISAGLVIRMALGLWVCVIEYNAGAHEYQQREHAKEKLEATTRQPAAAPAGQPPAPPAEVVR